MRKNLYQERLKQQESINHSGNEPGGTPAGRPEEPAKQNTVFSGPLRNYPSEKTMPEQKPASPLQAAAYDPVQDELRMIEEEKNYQLKLAKKQKLRYYIEKVFQAVLIASCVYLVFLIYGVLNTNYVYDKNNGSVVPLVVPVESIRAKAEYEVVSTQYLQARTLYEEVLKLDYRLGMATNTGEDPLLIAPEYEKLLEKVSSLSVQMAAQTVPAQYTQPYNMLLSWVQNDIALYCQYISRAITQNSVTDMNQALSYKESMYNNFMRITEIVATLGSKVDNVDVSIIINWSPEAYISQYSGGV